MSNCNYTLTFKVKLNIGDRLTTSGYIAFGAWDADKVNETTSYIEAGGHPTFRLNLGSVKVIDHTEIPEGVSDISMTFNIIIFQLFIYQIIHCIITSLVY